MHESQLPDVSEVTSPPPQSLSYYDDLELSEDPLGKGGQAIVYEATVSIQTDLNQVAIKQPAAWGPTVEDVSHSELLSEAETWEMLARKEREKPRYNNVEEYEHIVGIIDSGDTPAAWIAMEYMDGGNLEQRLAEQKTGLPIAESLWIGECLCRAIELAHNEGTAHLDLKPSNILFRKTDPDVWDVPKIADWGMARDLATEQQATERFSPAYAAPEQFEINDGGYPDTATDIYQLGAVIYEMLTGHPPHGDGLTKIKAAHMHGETPPTPSSHRAELSPVVDDCILRALEPEKTDRYRSVSNFEESLNTIRTGQESETVGRSTGIPSQKNSEHDTTRWALFVDVNSSNDVSSIKNAVRSGGIIFAKFGGLHMSDGVTKGINDFISEIDGDVIKVGSRLLIMTPSGVEISRELLGKGDNYDRCNAKMCVWITVTGCPSQKIKNKIHEGDIVVSAKRIDRLNGMLSELKVDTIQATNKRSVILPEQVEAKKGFTTPPSAQELQSVHANIRSDATKSRAMFQSNPARTGTKSHTPGPQREVTERWKSNPGGETISSPAVVDGTVYIGCWNGSVYALNANNGTTQWKFNTGGEVESLPTVAGGTVYVGSNDSNLYAVNASTGKKEWAFETGSWIRSSPAVAGGTVYVVSNDNNLYAVDASTGKKQWVFETDGKVMSSPAVAEDTVYVGGYGGVYALDAETGNKEWSFETVGRSSSPAVAEGTVYVGSESAHLGIGENGYVYALNAETGDEEWSFETVGGASSPAVAEGTVYVGSEGSDIAFKDGYVYALDVETGDEEWSFNTGSRGASSPAVAKGTVYVEGGGSTDLYALDATTGDEEWSFNTGSRGKAWPAVAKGTVYVASGYNVYALE